MLPVAGRAGGGTGGRDQGQPAYRPPEALVSDDLHAEGRRLEGRGTVGEELESLRGQVVAIETGLAHARRHWYRDAASIVAILALAFSFGTTVVSLNRTAQQDR